MALVLITGALLPLSQLTFAQEEQPGWPATTPEEQGFDSAKLADVLVTIQETVPNVHSLLILRNGSVLLDAYFYPYDGSTPHEVASVTKSLTTTLIGIAIDQGKLSLDQPVLSFFPDRTIANRDERKERMTVGDLASMTSGLDCVAVPDEPTLGAMFGSPDWVQFVLDLPMVAEPGTTFAYCSPATHLLSAVLTQATGMTEFEFAQEYLFGPLDMTDVSWPEDPQGFSTGWGDAMLHPRDMAKIGQLWINGGVWDGKRIVSQEWVKDAATIHAVTDDDSTDYGYGWWVERESEVGGEFSAVGRGGQHIVVFPAVQTVVVTTGGGTFDSGNITGLLTAAVGDLTAPLPANPDGVARLNETVAKVVAAPAPQPVPPLPPMAETISGKVYEFGLNPLNMKTLRLIFDRPDEATAEMTTFDDQPPVSVAIGLDGVYRMTPGDYDFPIGMRGSWEDDQTFMLDYDAIANREAYTLRMRFDGDSVTIEAKERTHEAVLEFEGQVVGS
jgi:CubicO group peptidase (beta-lactamase class C family)